MVAGVEAVGRAAPERKEEGWEESRGKVQPSGRVAQEKGGGVGVAEGKNEGVDDAVGENVEDGVEEGEDEDVVGSVGGK